MKHDNDILKMHLKEVPRFKKSKQNCILKFYTVNQYTQSMLQGEKVFTMIWAFSPRKINIIEDRGPFIYYVTHI